MSSSYTFVVIRSVAAVSLAAGVCLLTASGAAASQPAPKTVLILRSATQFSAPALLVQQIESGLLQGVPHDPIDFFVEAIDTHLFPSDEHDRRLADLYRERYASRRPDLVIAIGDRTLDFALRHRSELFPQIPLMFGLVNERFVGGRALGENVTGIFVKAETQGTLDLALRLHPSARRVIVVGGTSPIDRQWESIVREDMRAVESRIQVTYWTDRPIKELLGDLTTLRRDVIVWYVMMSRDGAGVITTSSDVLGMMRRATRAPIYSFSEVYLGRGIVGGMLIDFRQHGVDLARQARQLLDGRNPADLPPTTTANLTAFDWRELQRYRISEAALPQGSTVQYREPDFWRRRGGQIGIVALLLADVALVAALARQRRHRRRLEASATRRLRFETLLSDLLLAFAKIPVSQTGPALDASLRRVAGDVDVDAVWLWEFGDAGDPEWTSLRLQSGDAIVLGGADDLPRPLREKLTQAPRAVGSIAATPLDVSGVVLGALFWPSSRHRASWSPEMFEHLRMISDVFATVVQRKHADIALQQSDRLKGAILSSLPAQVAVLDRSGTIIAVNDVWADAERATGGCAGHAMLAGGSYLEACGAAVTRAGAIEAAEILAGVTAVCEGRSRDFECEYRCDAPGSDRWFVMRVTPLRSEVGGAVVTHWDVTERKRAEIVVRESEDQYRRLADALPIGIWMSGIDGEYNYFNKTWLELTGRRLHHELGSGWLDGVHPDERESCREAYMRAFAAREPFSMEYRLRRYDGQYRWVLNKGVPRSGADGTFLGFVGGVVDLTARRHAEQALRALSGRLIGAQEDERRRIARELHDNLGQRLALMAMAIDRFATTAPESVRSIVADLRTNTNEVAQEVHTLSHRLHSSKLDALGLVAAVRGHCQEVSQHGLAVHFVDSDVPKTLPSETALCVFRIAQEALNNVVKHSGATEARVWLSRAHDTLVLQVEDAGRGFDTTAHDGGLGLVSMHERLRSIGGEMTVRSSPGHGTTIEARVPIRTARRADEPSSSSRAELRAS